MELVNLTEGTDTNIDFANIRRVFKYPLIEYRIAQSDLLLLLSVIDNQLTCKVLVININNISH